MPVFNKFCCCCTLKTGGVIFGWTGLVGSIFNIATISTLLANMDVVYHQESQPKYVTQALLSVDLASCVVFVVSYALLVLGAIKGNRYMLLPWLITGMVGLIGSALAVVILGPILLASGRELVVIGVFIFCLGLPFCALNVYYWLCVLSLFQHLRDVKNSGFSEMEAPRTVNDIVQGYNPPAYEKLGTHLNV